MSDATAGRLGWVIVYVPDVEAAVALYELAFGLSRRFVAPGGSFAELETGATALAFASEEMAESGLPDGFERPSPGGRPFNVELCLVFDDVEAAFARAVDAGCAPLSEPAFKPHGQTVSYVRGARWTTRSPSEVSGEP